MEALAHAHCTTNHEPRTTAQHHYQQAELTLATLGSLAATPEEATRETAAALVHAVLAIAAQLMADQPRHRA
jgi:hypothetical protein